jgi:hypothetical protein
MSHKQFIVFGIYSNFPAIRAGVDTLKKCGVRSADISVLFPESAVARTLPEESSRSPVAPKRGWKAILEPLIGGSLEQLTYVKPEDRDVVSGALLCLGVPSADANHYDLRIRSGGLLLCVRSSDQHGVELAAEVIAHTGAEHITCAGDFDSESSPASPPCADSGRPEVECNGD